MLQSQLTPDVINELSTQVGASPQQTQVAEQGAISALLTGLAQNTQTPEGADSLYKALDVHDGSILNNIMGLVTGTAQAPDPSALSNSSCTVPACQEGFADRAPHRTTEGSGGCQDC